jgi:hypothetical protein
MKCLPQKAPRRGGAILFCTHVAVRLLPYVAWPLPLDGGGRGWGCTGGKGHSLRAQIACRTLLGEGILWSPPHKIGAAQSSGRPEWGVPAGRRARTLSIGILEASDHRVMI